MRKSTIRIIGALGAAFYIGSFIHAPSFPTPDKIFVLLVLGGMVFGQTLEVLKRFTPFVVLLLVYESFRGLATTLNSHVNYGFMVAADKLLFLGHLPTTLLQNLWWHGRVQWYDFVFYGAYTLHFVLPFALAVLIWKTREKHYWRFITTYVTVSFAGFLTYVAFPAAPPWLASDKGLIEPIARVSTAIWYAFGIHDFPSVYNKIAANPVAAMPSLHAAYAALFVIFIFKLYKTRWRWLAVAYPLLIWVGTTYMGEHYVIDIIAGIIYAVAGYWAAPYILAPIQKATKRCLQILFKKHKQKQR